MTWEKRGEAIEFKFSKKGESITGQLVDQKTTRFDSKSYTILTSEGISYYFFGCHRLDSILPPLISKYVRITYKGKKKIAKNQTLREFDVDVWKTKNGELPEGFEEGVPF